MGTLLTFLRPNNDYPCFTSKTYRRGEGSKPPVKVSDYKLGLLQDVEVVKVKTIEDVYWQLANHAENWVRVNGSPREDLPYVKVQRLTENFPESSSRLVMLDLDDWDAKDEIWDFTSPDSVQETVKNLLEREGFGFLNEVRMVILTTSGQWHPDRLRCHIYFLLDDPIHITLLREWTTALKQVRQRAVFDPATQRSVQPDYISRRRCQGFEDPTPEAARLSITAGEPQRRPHLSLEEFTKRIHTDIGQAGWTPGLMPGPSKLGKNWLETLRFCGGPEGINEVSYRAAAQLVQEQGRDRVTSKIHEYAATMHGEAWVAINENDPYSTGARDRKNDVETYTVARFQQYLTSAVAKPFGKSADENKKIVADAILAASLGDIAGLYDHTVTNAWFVLKGKHPGIFAEVRNEFKQSLRGQVSVGEYEKAAQKVCRQMDGDDEIPGLTGEGDAMFLRRVLQEFDYLEDDFGVKFAGWQNQADNKYRIAPFDTELQWAFYAKGMDLSGGTVSPQFGRTCMQLLTGSEVLKKGGINSTFRKEKIAIRVYPEQDTLKSWINLGLQPSGRHLCASIDENGVKFVLDNECPVKWIVPDSADSIITATRQQITDRFGSEERLKVWTANRLFEFFNIDLEDRATFLGIVFSLLSGRGTSPIIEFTGPPSSGKSTAADLLMDLVDPVKGVIGVGAGLSDLSAVKSENLINVVSTRYLTAFDNVSLLSRAQQDALCQISTGAAKDQRVLYVGTFVRIFAKRPILMTALSSVITRPDLESRKEEFHFTSRQGFSVQPRVLAQEWEGDRPFLFVGLLHLLSDALQLLHQSEIGDQDGLDIRRAWFTLADQFYYGQEEIAHLRRERRFDRARTMLENSDFSMALAAWLQSQEDEKGNGLLVGRSLDMFDAFREWITLKMGTNLFIKTPCGDIHWRARIAYETRGSGGIPQTVQGFVWECSKQANIIYDVTGWVLNDRSKKTANGNHKTWRREGFDPELDEL